MAAAAAAAAASQSVQPSSHIHRSIPGQSVVSNHGLTPFQQSKLRSSSSSPPPNKLSSHSSLQQQHASRRSPPTSDSPNTGEERFDLDEDVDVEQCSDGEDESRSGMDTKHSSNGLSDPRSPGGDATASSNNNDETYSGRETSSSTSSNPPKKKDKEKVRIMKAKCNCEELKYVDCFLETKELWDKFNELGTEMIITKTGR